MSVRESRKHVLLTWGSPGLVWAASPWVPIAATSCLARLQHWEQKRGGEDEAWPDHYSKCTCALWRTQFPHNSIMTKELISLKMTTRTNLSAPALSGYEGTYPAAFTHSVYIFLVRRCIWQLSCQIHLESTWTERANKERERCLCDCRGDTCSEGGVTRLAEVSVYPGYGP